MGEGQGPGGHRDCVNRGGVRGRTWVGLRGDRQPRESGARAKGVVYKFCGNKGKLHQRPVQRKLEYAAGRTKSGMHCEVPEINPLNPRPVPLPGRVCGRGTVSCGPIRPRCSARWAHCSDPGGGRVWTQERWASAPSLQCTLRVAGYIYLQATLLSLCPTPPNHTENSAQPLAVGTALHPCTSFGSFTHTRSTPE